VTYRVAFFAARKIAAALKRGEKAKAKVTRSRAGLRNV